MKSLCNPNDYLFEAVPPANVASVLSQFGLVNGKDYGQTADKLLLMSVKAQSLATQIRVALANHQKSINIEVKFKWKEISYDGLIRDPSNYGPEWDQETVNGWGGGYDTEDGAIAAMVEFKAKHDLRYEYTLMKIYK